MHPQRITIPLTRGKEALIDEDDLPLVSGYAWFALAGGSTDYAYTKVNGRTVYMHALILGGSSRSAHIHHIDGNGLNNTRQNICRVDVGVNVAAGKRRVTNTSGYIGVTLHRATGRWQAQIAPGGRRLHLGAFDDPAEAAIVRDRAARLYFGEHARLNFPDVVD